MKSWSSILWLAAGAALLAAAGRLNPRLLALRQECQLNQAAPLENSPPVVAFTTVALGGFRGILADMLWLRAASLQEEGRYFELVQLSDWITKLEPRFSAVWAYQAWNMAYNISVLFNSEEDRWRWVRHGISLLRDEGAPSNPGDARLYRELGWLFQHKIGMDYDQAHLYYKKAWADEMMNLFQAPRPDWARLPPETTERMRRDYGLDPDILSRLDQEYGPFDWRLPQPHALYWAFRSKECASGFDAIAADRMILQCLAESVKAGRLLEDPARKIFALAPRPDLLPKALKAYQETDARYARQQTFHTAYLHFLRGGMPLLFTCGRENEARQLYQRLKKEFPSEASGSFEQDLAASLAGGDPRQLQQEQRAALVMSLLQQGAFWESQGDPEQARGFRRLAALCWTVFNAIQPLPPLEA